MTRRTRMIRILSTLALSAVAAACVTPFSGGSTDINYDEKQSAGPIQFSDPRLFRREALINERNDERDYLGRLIKESETIPFGPEIIREMETITSLAANLGIRFDPAAGLNYRRDSETSGIQQEIATLRLQMELEQLKRDVEIFRTNLASQTAASQTLGAAATTSAADLQGNVTPPDTAQITAQINSLQQTLAGRLDAVRTALTPGGGIASPIDAFYDRSAYRALLTRARNAASLDELHDTNGSALIRLSFSATVLPPPRRYSDSLGVLRMQVEGPEWTSEEREEVYRRWLLYVGRALNRPLSDGTFVPDLTLLGLAGGELFDVGYYYYPLSSGAACTGLSFDPTTPAGCGVLRFALPRPVSGDDLQTLYSAFTARGQTLRDELITARSNLVGMGAANEFDCTLGPPATRTMLSRAFAIDFLMRQAAEADLQARALLAGVRGNAAQSSEILLGLEPYAPVAGGLIGAFRERARARGCPTPPLRPSLAVPTRFTTALREEPQRVAVYDITPRELTQRVSSSARAANAISLAAAVAAQAPSAGVGANAGIGFARNAAGRVDALERIPLAVSFTEAGDGHSPVGTAFGWLLGPRMTLNPRGSRLELQQRLAPYDLSVDLAVPGWWPYLTLRAETAWAPNWRAGDGRTVAAQDALSRPTRVPLPTNSADMAAFTARLTGDALTRTTLIRAMVPDRISACAASTELQIRGANLWRADAVIIGGRRFEGAQVRVLPDMDGISVTIPKGRFAAYTPTATGRVQPAQGAKETNQDTTIQVTVLTPYGPAEYELPVDQLRGSDGGCLTDSDRSAAAPTIESLDRTQISMCHPGPSFAITGSNLSGVTAVRLGGETGTWEAGPNANSGIAHFSQVNTRNVFAGVLSVQLVVRTAGGAASRDITIAPAECS